MCLKYKLTDDTSSSGAETENPSMQFYFVLQFSGATIPTSKGDAGASTSKGDAGASTSKEDAGASTSIEDSGASTSKGDSAASTSKGDSGASTSKGDAGASTSKGDAGASTSKGDAGASTLIEDSGASTSKGDSGASTSKGDAGTSSSSENGFYGPAGAAAMLFVRDRDDSDRFSAPINIFRQGLGNQTITVAEYRGLILGLKETIRRGYTEIAVQGSSELVVNQILGNSEINDPGLRTLYDEALEQSSRYQLFSISHINEDLNREVDYQATRAISLPDGQVEVDEDSFYTEHRR